MIVKFLKGKRSENCVTSEFKSLPIQEEALGRTEVTNGENSFIKAVRWNTVRQQRAVWALEGKQWHEERGILAPRP